jgi:Mrp family chromosome partitioning ATPase
VADQVAVLRSSEVAAEASALSRTEKPPRNLPAGYFLTHTAVTASPAENNLIVVALSGSDAKTAVAASRILVTAYENVRHRAVADSSDAALHQLDTLSTSVQDQLKVLDPQLAAAAAQAPDPTQREAVQSLLTQRQQLLDRLAALTTKRDGALVDSQRESQSVSLYGAATTAERSLWRGALPVLVVAVVLGTVVSVALAYLLALRNRLITAPRAPERLLAAPLIVEVPLPPPGVAAAGPAPPRPPAARAGPRQGEPATVAVVSATDGDGRSTVCAQVARALAAAGLRTLVIDDGRSGDPPDRFDVVLMDVAPLLSGDTSPITRARRVIVVVRHESAVSDVEEVGRRLHLLGAHVLGYVYTRGNAAGRLPSTAPAASRRTLPGAAEPSRAESALIASVDQLVDGLITDMAGRGRRGRTSRDAAQRRVG